MASAGRLSALGGVARQRGLLPPKAARFEQDLERLAERVGDFGLEPETVHLARELVGFQPKLGGTDERFAAICLVVASLIGEAQGCTRVPLPGGAHGLDFVGETLAALLAPREGEEVPAERSPAAVARQLEQLLAGESLSALVGAPGAFVPLIRHEGWLSHQKLRAQEGRVAERIGLRLRAELPGYEQAQLGEVLEQVLAAPPLVAGDAIALSPEQQLALLTPFAGGPGGGASALSLIVGPPGAGKTSALAGLLRCAVRLGYAPSEIGLAAPSAKAAARMAEATRAALEAIPARSELDERLLAELPEGKTLHRLLGWSKAGRFRHAADRPLPLRLLAVDETSMLELSVADALFAALQPDTLLILLGDADQLPAVGVGALLAQLVPQVTTTEVPWRGLVSAGLPEGDAAPTGALERVTRRLPVSFRVTEGGAGAHILAVAEAINAGDPEALFGDAGPARITPRKKPAQLAFSGVEGLLELGAGEGALDPFWERFYREFLRGDAELAAAIERIYPLGPSGELLAEGLGQARRVLAARARAKVLCVTNLQRGVGVEAANRALQTRHLAQLGLPSYESWAPGMPLLCVKNTYGVSPPLYNGDAGIVLRCQSKPDAPPRLMAVFERRGALSAFARPALADRLQPAWALSTHRAQGSEAEVVALVLPLRPIPLLSRRLLYTAVTRAKRSVTVVGDPAVLSAGVRRTQPRWSSLRERVSGAEDPPSA